MRTVRSADDLDAAAIVAVAHGERIELHSALLAEVADIRTRVKAALAGPRPVYGVNTGLGARSEERLDEAEQALLAGNILLGRAAGGPPWLDAVGARAVLAARLATLLVGDSGVSPELCTALAAALNAGLVPAIPTAGAGCAGEIIPLAHAFGPLTGIGRTLDTNGQALPAQAGLRAAGLSPMKLEAKEGIALIEGVPATTGVGALVAAEAGELGRIATLVAAAATNVIGAPRDPYRHELYRGDDEALAVAEFFNSVAGPELHPGMLQAPISFRVVVPVLAHLRRTVAQLDAAIARALKSVTDSPAFLSQLDADPEFVGTAGFHGFELAGCCDALSVAAVHAAELAAAQSHRLLDDTVTGLPRQLVVGDAGNAGLVVVHKRAVGTVHTLRRLASPVSLGSAETSFGQEDLQSFCWLAAQNTRAVLAGWREVLACQLLTVWQAHRLAAGQAHPPDRSVALAALLAQVDQLLEPLVADRPFGIDIETLVDLLTRPGLGTP